MEYTDLEYFIAIAEHHNLTRAAEALYVSQPTLTKYLHKLEKNSVEKSLDEMDTSMILLFGPALSGLCKKSTGTRSGLEKELSDMRSYYNGELNIALPPMRSTSLIPQLLPAFNEKHPGVCINFSNMAIRYRTS